jgi:hypothetical protein
MMRKGQTMKETVDDKIAKFFKAENVKVPSQLVKKDTKTRSDFKPTIGEELNNQTEEVQLEAVKKNGFAIQYIKNPSKEVQLEAVKRNGSAIRYIKKPSEEVQLTAVKNDGLAIYYIKNPSKEVQLEAVKSVDDIGGNDGSAIQFIKNPSKEVMRVALKRDPKCAIFFKREWFSD